MGTTCSPPRSGVRSNIAMLIAGGTLLAIIRGIQQRPARTAREDLR